MYFMKIDFVEMKYGVQWLITITCVTYMQRDFYIPTWIKQLLTKYQFYTTLLEISLTQKNRNL